MQPGIQELLSAMALFTQQLGNQSNVQASGLPALLSQLRPNEDNTSRTNDDNAPRTNERSLSPVLRRNTRKLSPMSRSYKKTLHVNYKYLYKIYLFI